MRRISLGVRLAGALCIFVGSCSGAQSSPTAPTESHVVDAAPSASSATPHMQTAPDAGITDAGKTWSKPKELDAQFVDDWYCYQIHRANGDTSEYLSFCYPSEDYCEKDRFIRQHPEFTSKPCSLHQHAFCLKVRNGLTLSENRYCGDTMDQCYVHKGFAMRKIDQPELIYDCKKLD